MEFSREEYWIGLLFPPPEDLHDLGIEPGRSPALQADPLVSEPPGKPQDDLHPRSKHAWEDGTPEGHEGPLAG